VHYAEYKTILSPQNGINLYRGCTHGCIYCDSRSKCYQIDHPFEDIEVKQNAVQILEQQLRRKRNPCMIGTGSMCDPYLHLEEKLQLTRQCIELIDRYGFGLTVLTKSDRILRDMDLLQSINQKTKCVVQMTLTTYDDKLCQILEPNVAVTSKRIAVLKEMQRVGIPTVVWLCPILPFINDTEENLNGILDACIDAGVKGIVNFGFGVTLRDGNREYFFNNLQKHFPGLSQKYIQTFGTSYICNSPNHAKLMNVFQQKCKVHNILHDPDTIFSYLHAFETKQQQLSMF
jgi:DNA repair photolyase